MNVYHSSLATSNESIISISVCSRLLCRIYTNAPSESIQHLIPTISGFISRHPECPNLLIIVSRPVARRNSRSSAYFTFVFTKRYLDKLSFRGRFCLRISNSLRRADIVRYISKLEVYFNFFNQKAEYAPGSELSFAKMPFINSPPFDATSGANACIE